MNESAIETQQSILQQHLFSELAHRLFLRAPAKKLLAFYVQP
jgi:hypothetical protein